MLDTNPDRKPAQGKSVPHEPLAAYYDNEEERAGFVQRIFNATAVDYNRVENILGLGTGRWYRRKALERAGLKPGMRVVDVAFGTGLVAEQAVEIIGDAQLLLGVDPSVGMMQASRLAGKVQLVAGRAEQLPLPDACADFLSMGYALRHLSDLDAAFAEFRRVLRPGGRLCLLEITQPETAWHRRLLKTYVRGWVPLAARLFGASTQTPRIWRYYWDTIEACAPPARIKDIMRAQGLDEVSTQVELGIFYEYHARVPL